MVWNNPKRIGLGYQSFTCFGSPMTQWDMDIEFWWNTNFRCFGPIFIQNSVFELSP